MIGLRNWINLLTCDPTKFFLIELDFQIFFRYNCTIKYFNQIHLKLLTLKI